MSNATLLNLPVELLHRIFDHCDVQTIFYTVRRVCKQLVSVIDTYDRLELNVASISLLDLRYISRFMRPENVISLTTSDGGKKRSRKMRLFSSRFDLGRFTRLRSLSLGKMHNVDLEEFLQRIASTSLISLSIDVNENETENSKLTDHLLSIMARSSFRKLKLTGFDYNIDFMLLPVQSVLYHLTINSCTYSQYYIILDRCPHLQTFVMKNCRMNDNDRTFSLPSACTRYPLLTSLAIGDCRLRTEDLESLLSLTPSLTYLKLISSRLEFDSVFRAAYWKWFISNKLPLLDKFDFFFSYHVDVNANIPNLESIITPFRAPFWLDDKHWFVTCDYVMSLAQITLYTIPAYTANAYCFIRCEALFLNGLRLFTRQRTTNTIDAHTDELSTSVQLYESPFGGQAVQDFADALEHTTTLTRIHLSEDTIGSQEIQYLANKLQNNITVTSLTIESNRIRDQEAQHFADILRHNKTLTELSLSENQIGDQGARHLAEALQNNTTLVLLNLTYNQIREQGARYLVDALQNNKTLTEVQLRGNQMGHQGAKYFAEILQKNTPLTTLSLDDNQIANQGVQYLAAALRNNTTLIEFYLRDNHIGDEGAQCLADALQDNKVLNKFFLEGNQIGVSGAQHFASALQTNTTLTELFLGGNQIGDQGVHHLANGLRNNKALVFLHLYGNQIGDQGAQYLADALRENKTLTQINLESNQIGDDGAQHLADALRNNSTLTYLVLYDNQIGKKGLEYLVDALLDNMTLTGLYIDNDEIEPDIWKRIQELLQRNLNLNTKN